MFFQCPSSQTPAGIAQHIALKQSICSTVPSQSLMRTVRASGKHTAASAVFLKDAVWKTGMTLNISFVNGEPWQQAWVQKSVIDNIQPVVNLILNFDQTATPRHITISFDSDGASSLVGNQSSSAIPSMNLGWVDAPDNFEWKGVKYVPAPAPLGAQSKRGRGMHRNNEYTTGATVVHEFCHALGMMHEHQNPRGVPIEWNKQAVWNAYCGSPNNWDWNTIQRNILDQLELNTTNGSEFDPKSIMIYQFSPELTLNMSQGTSMNAYLSDMDKEWLSKTYPPSTAPPPSTTPPQTTSTPLTYMCRNGRCVVDEKGTEDGCIKGCSNSKGWVSFALQILLFITIVIGSVVMVLILSKKGF